MLSQPVYFWCWGCWYQHPVRNPERRKNTLGKDKLQRIQSSSPEPRSPAPGLQCLFTFLASGPVSLSSLLGTERSILQVLGSWASPAGHNSACSPEKERGHTPLPAPSPAQHGESSSAWERTHQTHDLKSKHSPSAKPVVSAGLVATSPCDAGVRDETNQPGGGGMGQCLPGLPCSVVSPCDLSKDLGFPVFGLRRLGTAKNIPFFLLLGGEVNVEGKDEMPRLEKGDGQDRHAETQGDTQGTGRCGPGTGCP